MALRAVRETQKFDRNLAQAPNVRREPVWLPCHYLRSEPLVLDVKALGDFKGIAFQTESKVELGNLQLYSLVICHLTDILLVVLHRLCLGCACL